MRTVAVASVVLAVAASAWAAEKAKVVDGKAVLPVGTIAAKPLIEVKDLKFFRCKTKDDGKWCTVVTGALVSHYRARNCTIIIEIALQSPVTGPTDAAKKGARKIEIKVVRPLLDSAVPFTGRGPAWSQEDRDENSGEKPTTGPPRLYQPEPFHYTVSFRDERAPEAD